jgi:hypothetical protein
MVAHHGVGRTSAGGSASIRFLMRGGAPMVEGGQMAPTGR